MPQAIRPSSVAQGIRDRYFLAPGSTTSGQRLGFLDAFAGPASGDHVFLARWLMRGHPLNESERECCLKLKRRLRF